ncbi:MAG: hypothetical protein IIY21_16560 [Clostridiales bacterium]|nr:hypothetical protein [Clostridiales bacterium]
MSGDKDVPAIDFRKLTDDKTEPVRDLEIDNHDIKKRNHYDKGYIWE